MKYTGLDHCPVCSQRGTVTTDPDGYVLVRHEGRRWPCRPRPATVGEWAKVQAASMVAAAREGNGS